MAIVDDVGRIALQERELVFSEFNEETAWRIGNRLRTLATERSLSVVIDVRRLAQPLFYAALPGTTSDNPEWVRRKSNVVFRFHRSSYAVGLDLEQKHSSIEARGLPVADYAAHGGSFPIRVQNAGLVAAVTVSGLPQRADHELVVEALCAELNKDYASLRLS
ncbi:MAG TPA: heme-degrading domain-containing protein [Acidobacteriaceae bacterium]|nr:heme-degrading domain-containing protein [Acidobacteriaceae bacterium]